MKKDMSANRYMEIENSSLIHPMSSFSEAKNVPALVIEKGESVYVFDSRGNRYLDAQAGLWCVNVGHGRVEINNAINNQLQKIAYYSTFGDNANQPALDLANKLTEMLHTEQVSKVFFSNSGSEAVETALKLARQFWKIKGSPDKTNFISLTNGYHGVSFGGTSLNGQSIFRDPYGPLLGGCCSIPSPCVYRNPWTQNPDELVSVVIDKLETLINEKGPGHFAALIAEPVQGVGGIIVPPARFWPELRRVCDQYDILLIADEVITGFGRSGTMLGSRGWGVIPDIMCFAKGINSGYIPLGATTLRRSIADEFETDSSEAYIMHGYTYSGHPVACAAAIAALELTETENLADRARKMGDYCLKQMDKLFNFPWVGDIRGKGLMIGIDLVSDKTDRTPLDYEDPLLEQIDAGMRQRNVLVRVVGASIIISPPLIVTKSHIDEIVNALYDTFEQARISSLTGEKSKS